MAPKPEQPTRGGSITVDASTSLVDYAVYDENLLPRRNADGLDVVKMSDAQKYEFDLRGWILLPGLLTEEQLVPIREHQLQLKYDKQGLPPAMRDVHAGPSQVMLDHPVVVGVLNEILSNQSLADDDCYGFRMDHTGTRHSTPAKDGSVWGLHGGGGLFNFPGNSHMYHMEKGRVHAGLTRVVWELNRVGIDDGGTKFISGSHKSAFSRPADMEPGNPLLDTYECPAGSAIIFTEALCHTGTTWTGAGERLAVFTCYDTVNSKWGNDNTPIEVIEKLPKMRQSLYRDVRATGDNKQFLNKNTDRYSAKL